MNAYRWIRKLFAFAMVVLLLFTAGAALLSYLYGEQLVDQFLEEANKKIATPIHTQNIEVSWWEKFPQISIALREVVIDGSLPGSGDTLGVAANVYFTFNAWDILRRNWEVSEVHMEDGKLFMVYSQLGDNNYTIIKKDSTAKGSGVGFSLDRIQLKNVDFTYLDLRRNQQYDMHIHQVESSLQSQQRVYDIQLQGSISTDSFRIKDRIYLKNKELEIDSDLVYQDDQKHWDFGTTLITLNESLFEIQGWYQNADTSTTDLSVVSRDTDIQTVLSLLPPEIARTYKDYRSKGEVYFKTHLEGPLNADLTPELTIDFGCTNASFFHPNYQKGVEQVTLKGQYHSPQAANLSSATLSLENIKGVMEGFPFGGNLTIKNFNDYHLNGALKGTLDVESWQKFLPQGKVTAAQGKMDLDVSFNGQVRHLKSNRAVDNFKTSGALIMDDVSFSLAKNSLPFESFNGHFLFNGRDLAISDFSGHIGNTDFLVNGLFRNIIAFLFSKNQAIGIEADLKAQNIDLDELLTGRIKSPDVTVVGNQSYTSFEISPRLKLQFNCDVDHLKFRRFRGRALKGKLRVENQVAYGENLSVHTLGGKIDLNGQVNGKKKNHITINTRSSYDGIYLDSLFFVFENFSQEFLQDRHLKGQAYAEIDSRMAFDNYLRFKPADLVVDAGLIIENGELNDFAPMQKLASFVERRSLANMTFGDLKNDIHIEDQVIHLPNMQVQSNVTTIMVNGTHSFSQQIDYRLKVPLKGLKKDKDEYYGAIEEDGAETNLFLKILGTTSDYRIVLDQRAVKNKIKEDLREEKWEIRDAIRNKGVDDRTQELNEDEFFDFDSDSTSVE